MCAERTIPRRHRGIDIDCLESPTDRRAGGNFRSRRDRGVSTIELAIALPVLLLFGFSIVQFGLIYQAKSAIEYAVLQGARRGSVAHADMQAVKRGLAQGIAPWLYGATDAASLQVAEARALAHLEDGMTREWIKIARVTPSSASFTDWGVPARDAMGDPIQGMIEIPNDNLDSRRFRMQPASGVSGTFRGEAIGASSGLTLHDANQLQLKFAYGLRLSVPVAGQAIIAALRLGFNCADSVPASDSDDLGFCKLLLTDPPRLVLRSAATVRMMSSARQDDPGSGSRITREPGAASESASGVGSGSASGSVPAGAGPVDPAAVRTDSGSAGTDQSAPTSDPESSRRSLLAGVGSGSGSLVNGFLGIGSDRAYPVLHPGVCQGS